MTFRPSVMWLSLLWGIGQLLALPLYAQLPVRRPLVVIFVEREEAQADQLDRNLGIASPLAELLQATRRVDALIYEPTASYVQRAIQEGLLRSSEAAATPSAEQKRRITQALGGEIALTVRAVWQEKPPEPARAPRGGRIDADQLRNLPPNPVVRISATWMPVAGGRSWQVQLESQPVQRALPNGRLAIDPVSTAHTAANNLLARLLAEPMASLARVEVTQAEAQSNRPPSPPAEGSDADRLMQQLLEEGDRFVTAGDLANAIESYRRAADVRPTHPEPRRRLIETYLKRRMEEEAVEEGLRAMQIVVDSSSLWLALADAYVSTNRMDEAENLYRRMLERDPQNAIAWLHLGDLLWNRARIGEAEECYQRAAQHAPQNRQPLMRLTQLNLARARFAQAQQWLLRVYEASPADNEAVQIEVYLSIAEGIDSSLQQLAQRLQETVASYNNRNITLETLYRTLSGLEQQIVQLQQLQRTLRPAPRHLEPHQRLLLATTLLQQAVGSLITFAETSEPRYLDEGGLLRSEALRELAAAMRLLRASNTP